MILTTREYKDAGFIIPPDEEVMTEIYIRRAENILNAMCRGNLMSAATKSKSNSVLVKTAIAFETAMLFKREFSYGCSEKVSIGDVSYSETAQYDIPDVSQTVKELLCMAGCFNGTACTEVIG